MTARHALVALAACLPLAGCAAKTIDTSVGGSYERSGAATGKPGLRLLSMDDVRHQPPHSPERAVLTMLLAAKLGNVPRLISAYEPRTLEELGRSRLVSAYARRRPELRATSVEVGGATFTQTGATVIVRFVQADKTPKLYEFGLRKAGAAWLILRDSLVGEVLRRRGGAFGQPAA
jgi:hypothetical protein